MKVMREIQEIQEMKNKHDTKSCVLRLNEDNFRISAINILNRGFTEVKLDNRDYYNLNSGLYQIINEIVVPPEKTAILNTSKDLFTNGCFLTSSITNGQLSIMMNVTYDNTKLKKSTEIGEIFFVKIESIKPINI